MSNHKLGLIINPIAGIGGRVGLKGSDGYEIQQQALTLGAKPLAQERARGALEVLSPFAKRLSLLTPPGDMGERLAERMGFQPHILPIHPEENGKTTAEDTRRAAAEMQMSGVDLILFVGGDGTARDIYKAVGNNHPVLGVPAGVKIHSAVFGVTPKASGELAWVFLNSKGCRLREAPVFDLDEKTYRKGKIITKLHGYLMIPYLRTRIQNQKVPTPTNEIAQAQAIAADIYERLEPRKAYAIGPGTTTRAIAEVLGFPKTLVGVDIFTSEELLAKDVGERQILEILSQRPLGLIMSPIGGQGFLFGRGNQQISPEVIRLVGRDNITVICLARKIAALRGRPLLVDTGDREVDDLLKGYIEVITGYHEKTVYRISN